MTQFSILRMNTENLITATELARKADLPAYQIQKLVRSGALEPDLRLRGRISMLFDESKAAVARRLAFNREPEILAH